MTRLDPGAETMIQNWNHPLTEQIRITLMTADHALDSQFAAVADLLSGAASHLAIDVEKGEGDLPAFHLKENITWSAFPLGKALAPFLEALGQINGTARSGGALAGPPGQALDAIDIPVRLTLYIAAECPFCPQMIRTVIPLARHCSNIRLHIIDGTLFPEAAQKDAVMSAPCLILDDDFRWTGQVPALEIVKMITGRDPSQLSAGTLKTILEQGDAAWITRQMMDKGAVFDAFITLLVHDTWSVRLGAMVVVEELAETDPALAAAIGPLLIPLFDKKEIPVQGDILYALGEAGNRQTMEWIRATLPLLSHQDLIDAAEDALETLESKEE